MASAKPILEMHARVVQMDNGQLRLETRRPDGVKGDHWSVLDVHWSAASIGSALGDEFAYQLRTELGHDK